MCVATNWFSRAGVWGRAEEEEAEKLDGVFVQTGSEAVDVPQKKNGRKA